MSVKYRIEYTDVVGNEFTCEIDNDDYSGAVTVLDGRCIVSAAPVTDHYIPIRGKQMEIVVRATIAEPLSDLWQDDDFYWRTVLKRNGVIEFIGYLQSDGVFEDYNSDSWDLNLTSVGPLAVLNDLAYVQLDGDPYLGNASVIKVISNALKRAYNTTGERMKFRCYTDIVGDGQPVGAANSMFTYGHIDQSIYFDEGGEKYDNCLQVVSDAVESLGCVITQEGGYFYVMPLYFLAQSTSITFQQFSADGVYESQQTVSGLQTDIGSQGDEVASVPVPFHCSKNQQLSIKSSLDTFIVRNDHELDSEIMPNSYLNFPLGDPGFSSGVWSRNAPSDEVDFLDQGIRIYGNEYVEVPGGYPANSVAVTSPDVVVSLGETFEFAFVLETDTPTDYSSVFISVKLIGDNDDYWLFNTGEWFDSSILTTGVYQQYQDGRRVTITGLPVPDSGIIKVYIYSPLWDTDWETKFITVREISIKTLVDLETEATEATFKRTVTKKGKAGEVQSIRFNTGDVLKQKNILKDSTDNLIDHISSTSVTDKSLLYHNAFVRGVYLQNKAKIFSGNVYGKVPFLGIINYMNIEDKMLPIEWSYDTQRNITYIKGMKMVFNNTLNGVIEENIVFTETIKPTIQ